LGIFVSDTVEELEIIGGNGNSGRESMANAAPAWRLRVSQLDEAL
jgi:hypothetical protein